MNIKAYSSIIVFAIASAGLSNITQAATESSQTTIERSTSTDIPAPVSQVREEKTTTVTKRGLFGRKKSETTTSSTRYENTPDSTVRSKTTTETEKNY